MARVVLAMSGGVDSSVAAHLLLRAGHEVIGVFMRHSHTVEAACAAKAPAGEVGAASSPLLPIVTARSEHKQGCCTASDAEDARRVADRLDIPFYAIDFQESFEQIIDYFIDEYTHARTPNPCVMCNNWIKFGKLFDYADSVGADYVATGHYAQLQHDASSSADTAGGWRLLRGRDDGKDQSYVLFGLDRSLLARMLLPVGNFEKPEIRRLAGEIGLRVAEKKDSQEICFVTSGHHSDFIRAVRGDLDTAGEIVMTDGRVVGRHDGIEAFTIGQRKGLGVALGEPHFVVRIEADTHRVVLGRREELARRELTANRTNWLVGPTDDVDAPGEPQPCLAQIRYNATAKPATVARLPGRRMHVTFDEPVDSVSPGQAVVCYDGARVIGGGWIE